MPQVKRDLVLEEARRDARFAAEALDEDDVALVDHVELFGIPGAREGLPVDGLAVAQHADVRMGLAVSLREAEALVLGEGIQFGAQDLLRLLAAHEDAADAEDPVRGTEDLLLEEPDHRRREDEVAVDSDHDLALRLVEGPVDGDAAVAVISGVEREMDDAQSGIPGGELLEMGGEAVGAAGIRDDDLEGARRQVLAGEALEAHAETPQISIAGDEDRDARLMIVAREHAASGPEAVADLGGAHLGQVEVAHDR